MKTVNEIVRNVATEMLNTSMQDITAETIHGWATRLGDAATCKDSLQVGNKSLTPNEMETINDIVREMREFADADSQTIGRDVLRRRIQRYCDRIEAAHKLETVTDCNALQDTCKQSLQGNTAKMREALEKIKECYENDYLSLDRDPGDVLGDSALLANNALSAPLRNCDLYATQVQMSEAYEKYRKSAMKKRGSGIVGDVPFIKPPPMSYDEWMFATTTN